MPSDDVQMLKDELARLRARVEHLEGTGSTSATDEPVGRRNMLKGLGAAAVGAAAGGLAFARPAAAAPTDMFTETSHNVVAPTRLVPITGYSSNLTGELIGAFTVTNDPDFTSFNAALSCITAFADSSKPSGHSIGLVAASASGIGAKLDGPVPLKLTDNFSDGAPSQSAGTRGQFRVENGNLWYCAVSDGSQRWRRISGPNVAGAFHALTPGRVYDSREAQPSPGTLSTGNNRTVSVADRRNLVGGAVVQSNFVPANAKAITANVTVIATAGPGFLAVNPGGSTTVNAATVNWTAAGQIVNNGVTLAINPANRQVTVVCGGAGVTHFVIDVTGYFL